MKLYKAQITVHSPLLTLLKGDTIWGHVVWGIANNEGSLAVESFLHDCRKPVPEFVISSAFPSGLLPKPEAVDQLYTHKITRTEYSKIKEHKKERYIPSFLTGDQSHKDLKKYGHMETDVQMHNTIDRTDLMVSDDGLYSVSSLWPNPEKFLEKKPIFDLYITTTFDQTRVFNLLRWAFENGYGADSSTGKGVISVSSEIKELTLSSCKGKRCMALGPFVCNDSNLPKELLAQIFIRRGKVGGSFASFMIPYKKTMILFDEGATFIHGNDDPIIGTIVDNVHKDERICNSGFCPIVPLPDGGLHEATF